jgi:serine phosphatase RsbU (regulator of sigma subunit)
VPARDPDQMPGPRDERSWLLANFLLATGIAVLDASVSVVLLGFLVVPPMLAALRAGPVGTALIAGYCFALGIDSGVWNDFFLSSDHMIRLLVVALSGALAVWVAELRRRTAAAARAAGILGETGNLVEDALDEEAVVEHVVSFAIPTLASLCVIDLVQEDGTIRPASIASDRPEIARLFREMRDKYPLDPGRDHPIVQAIETGQTITLPSVPDSILHRIAIDQEHYRQVRSLHFQSALIVPLRVGGQTIGSLELLSTTAPDRYGPGEIALTEELARRAAIGIHNAREHGREVAISRTLQRSLLPGRLPDVPGFEVAARFRPQGTAVGGDFYDLFPAGEGAWAATIGDVCGKGPEAAVLTSLSRHTLRAATLHNDSPCETLETLNTALIDERRGETFCTAAYALLEESNGSVKVTICSGGHPEPYLVRAGGEVEILSSPGTVLGIFEDAGLVETETELHPGDSLVLYTDGVIEVRNGAAGPLLLPIGDVLKGMARQPAATIADRLETAALERNGATPMDDIAILVLRYSGEPAYTGREEQSAEAAAQA